MTDETKTPDPVTTDEEAAQDRVEVFFGKTFPEWLEKALAAMMKEDPLFVARIFADLVQGGLESLKHYLEDPEVEDISWTNPWTELHYPVEWDWETGGPLHLRRPEIPPAALDEVLETVRAGEDPFKVALDSVVELTSTALTEPLAVWVLFSLTNEVTILCKGGKLDAVFLMNPGVRDELDALPEGEERNARVEALREPFSIGGLEVMDEAGEAYILTALDHHEAETGTLPPWEENLEKRLKTIPKLTFNGEVNGTPFQGAVVLMIHPLVVDEVSLEAYFPIVVGLVFAPVTVTDKLEEVDPSTWPEEDKASLWKTLLEDVPRTFLEEVKKEEKGHAEVNAFGAPTVNLVPAGSPTPERRKTAGLAFGHTLASAQAMNIIRDAHKVRLPKKWSSIPRWESLKEKDVRDLLDEEGDRAFEDLRKTTGDSEERGPLLRRVTRADGKESVVLTAEAQDRLRRRAGLGRGFLDVDRYGQERLYRLFEVGHGGLLEVGLSWQGLAGPLVDEWRNDLKKQAEALARDLRKEPALFTELDEEKRRRVDSLLSQISLWEDGRRVMEAVLGQVGKQRRNPVEIPAEALRVLLWPAKAKAKTWPRNWKQRVEGALTALNALTFSLKTYHAEAVKGYGSMVGQWVYKGRGAGDHGDGVYLIDVSSGFIGCLQVFQSGKTKLRSGAEAVSFHFTKDLTKEERKALGWGRREKAVDSFVTFDAGRAFYSSAAGLTSTQENLLHFIEAKITRRGNTTRKENRGAQVPKNAPDAKEPRLYSSTFCSLIPVGKSFVGALGDFSRNPEVGFTLAGSESRAARHPGGLLHHMGHVLQSGAARAQRAEVITKALEDLKAVVVDYLGGIVAGHDGARWIPFEDFRTLDERTLTKGLRLFLFLPEDWEERRRAQWEEATGRRVTEDPEEAERETWEGEAPEEDLGQEVASSADGFRGWPLPRRLRGMMKLRGLRQKDLAAMFGVSPPVITYWLREEGGKPVPPDVVPLLVRWVEEGTPPTADELAILKTRRSVRPGKRKTS